MVVGSCTDLHGCCHESESGSATPSLRDVAARQIVQLLISRLSHSIDMMKIGDQGDGGRCHCSQAFGLEEAVAAFEQASDKTTISHHRD